MSDFDRPGTVEQVTRRRSTGSRFADLGDRLARTFGTVDRGREEPPRWEPSTELDYADASDTIAWAPGPERFPVVEHGYDPVAVDEEIAALERELGELRAGRLQSNTVEEEIDRIGQQTASILRTAYEQAHEITRSARQQADKCVADAAANAVGITEDANRRLRELDRETDSVWQERARLIEDARSVATELFSLAENAAERFREDSVGTGTPGAETVAIEPVSGEQPDPETGPRDDGQ
jgi:vacuolar-type H+-ATPase subunit H